MEESFLAWVAGIFDTGGTITVGSNGNEVRLKVCRYDEEVSDTLKAAWGGCLSRQKDPHSDRVDSMWIPSGRRATEVLKQIRPFLKTKRAQQKADLAIRITYWKWRKDVDPKIRGERVKRLAYLLTKMNGFTKKRRPRDTVFTCYAGHDTRNAVRIATSGKPMCRKHYKFLGETKIFDSLPLAEGVKDEIQVETN